MFADGRAASVCGAEARKIDPQGEAVMASTTRMSVAEMVTQARSEIENLSPRQVAQELQTSGVLLVDIREPDERTQSDVIGGSVHAPRGMLEFYADPASAGRVSTSPVVSGSSACSPDRLSSRSDWAPPHERRSEQDD
jgi:rhodanese-related sulfurtransferase